jgi:hypothetical protein
LLSWCVLSRIRCPADLAGLCYEVVRVVGTLREQLAPARTYDGEQYVGSNDLCVEHSDEVITWLDAAFHIHEQVVDRELIFQPQIVLVIDPAPKVGLFLGYVGGELIVRSRQPFLDGARALLARGYDPSTPCNMRHANLVTLCFVATTIGHAAGLRVADMRAQFRKFVPFEGSIAEPIAEAAE